MRRFTLDDLREIMRNCGMTESAELGTDILDVSFADLDYDSLAILEIATQIQQVYHMPFADEVVERMKTPRDMLEYINGQLAEV